MDEKTLITKSQNGDVNAFDELIKPYEARVYTFLARMCNNHEAAQDMAQETFLNVYKKIKTFRGQAKFSTWLFQIATNNCLMLKRYKASRPENVQTETESEHPWEIADWEMTPDKEYSRNELRAMLEKALQKLPPPYRSAFVLSEVDGFSGPQIAEILKISLPLVKARLRRAKERLQKLLKSSLLKQCCNCDTLPKNIHQRIISCIKDLQN